METHASTPAATVTDQRLVALVESGLLDSDPDAAFDRYTRLARRILDVPIALVSLVTDSRQFFKSEQGLSGPVQVCRETPLSHSFCRHVLSGEPLVVEDSRNHPELSKNPSVDELGVIAYAGFPIRNSEDLVFGALCVISNNPRRWSESELALLADLADGVSSEIRLREQLTRERQREAGLELAVSRLEAVERSLSDQLKAQEETTAMVSHDLRTPLSALLLSVGLIENQADQASRTRLAERMREAIRDMDGLVGDLLDVVRLNAGGLHYRFETLLAEDIFERLAELHHSSAAKGSVSVSFSGGAVRLAGDRRRLVQALSNLIANAIRAASPGGEVRISAVVLEDGAVQFAVADNGFGFDSNELRTLFAPFAQGDRPGSAGLGLAIARGIAKGHGGSLTAVGERGEGATFTLTVPADRTRTPGLA